MPRRPSLARLTAAAFATLLAPLAASAQESDAESQPVPGFAVVELFTSEGCSSCPPADRLLAAIDEAASSNDLPIYALSMHVDYWDRLGWADPYGSPEFSARQRSYARAFGARGSYTPQMVVNGTQEFVGSDAKRAQAAIGAALSQTPTAQLSLSTQQSGGTISVAYRTDAPAGSVLCLALVQPAGQQQVTRGENIGRELNHVNIVRALETVKLGANGQGRAELSPPADLVGDAQVFAYVQDPANRRVLAAAKTR